MATIVNLAKLRDYPGELLLYLIDRPGVVSCRQIEEYFRYLSPMRIQATLNQLYHKTLIAKRSTSSDLEIVYLCYEDRLAVARDFFNELIVKGDPPIYSPFKWVMAGSGWCVSFKELQRFFEVLAPSYLTRNFLGEAVLHPTPAMLYDMAAEGWLADAPVV